jgi:hypothetical protein
VALLWWRERFADGSINAREDALQFQSNTELQSLQCLWWCGEAPNAIRSWVSIHQFKNTQTTEFGCINTNFEFGTPISTSKWGCQWFQKDE